MGAGEHLSDADGRYLAQIREDCETCLGPETEMLGLDREMTDEGVRLVARYRLGKTTRESAAVGGTLFAAHKAMRARILFDRIRFGFSDLVERR